MFYHDLLETINEHKKSISHSFLFYRQSAKMQKLKVLNAATKYLVGKMSKAEFIKTVNKNPRYADAFGVSQTKLLMDAVLKETPSAYRTEEGYVRERHYF
jgi:hypothetical protein